MRYMHWSYPDLMMLPQDYLAVLIEMIDTDRRQAEDEKFFAQSRRSVR